MKTATKPKKAKRARKISGLSTTNPDTAERIFTVRAPLAGPEVTHKTALSIAAVYCGVTMLSNSVGSMPLHVYRSLEPSGKERVRDNPVAVAFAKKPNNFMTPIEFKSLIVNHILLRGDFFAHILQTGAGEVHLIPMDPDRVRVGSDDSDYSLMYAYRDPNGKEIPFLQHEVFHVKGLHSDGLRGMSVIRAAREGFSRAKAQDDSASDFIANNSTPAGVLKYPEALTKEEIVKLRDSWEAQHKGGGNRYRVAVLEQGLAWEATGINKTDAQWMESRYYEIEEIARWLNIQPHKLKHLLRATFTNIEHQGKEYYEDSVLPLCKRISEAITAKFFTDRGGEDLFAEFLFDSLLITDTLTRYLAHKHAIDSGWKTANEVRAIENMNPLPGLDIPRVQINTAPVGSKQASGEGDTPPPGDSEPTTPDNGEPSNGPDPENSRAILSRLFDDSLGRVRSRETKKWGEFRKKGINPVDLEEFYGKLEEFIPEAIDAVAISWGELCGASLPDTRTAVRDFASRYFDRVREGFKAGTPPLIADLTREIMDGIKSVRKGK